MNLCYKNGVNKSQKNCVDSAECICIYSQVFGILNVFLSLNIIIESFKNFSLHFLLKKSNLLVTCGILNEPLELENLDFKV